MSEIPENNWQKLFREVLAEIVMLPLKVETKEITHDQFLDIFIEKRNELFSIVENEVLTERLRIKGIIESKRVPVDEMSHDLKGKCDFEKNNTIMDILKSI